MVIPGFFKVPEGLQSNTVKTDSCGGKVTSAPSASLDEVKLLPRPTASGKTLVGRGS